MIDTYDDDALRTAFGLPEPSAEPIGRVIVMCARCGLFPVVAGDEINSDIVVCDRCAFTEGRESVQGEPTEAQVREEVDRREEYAEAHGYPAFQDEGSAFIDGAEWMRAALRAAYETRGEGR